jgi:cellulose synthase/poly-beta-1,6-N-acetylglucosamine synthase-like glycosyltransferase
MADAVYSIVFWGSLGLIAYTYAGYPLLVLLVGSVFRPLGPDPDCEPTVSVLIPAYNEEASISRKVRETLDLEYPPEKLEVVVVSDGSTDRTGEIMGALRHPQVRFFSAPRGGKTAAQNFGVERCRGEIVVFSDATSRYRKDAIRRLVGYFGDPRVGTVSGICRFFDGRQGKSPTGLGQILYGGYEQAIRVFQSRIRTATACSGPIYATRRELYVPLPPDACSDMVEPLEIVRAGWRVVYAPDAQAYEASTRSPRDEFRMRVRVTTQGMHGLIAARRLLAGARGWWVAFQILSHKGLRYFLPVPLVLLLGSSAALAPHHAPARLLFLVQAAFYGAALVALAVPVQRMWKLLGLPLYFCTGNAAVVLSVFQMLRGNRFMVWDTVRK